MQTLIIGATGNIGSTITQQLAARQIYPRLSGRSVERVQALFPHHKDIVVLDFTQPATFATALAGVQRLFFIAPHRHPVESIRLFLQVAKEAGVERVIFSSGRTTADIKGTPLYHVEQLVRASGISYTIIRPGWFMQNFTGWIGHPDIDETGKFYLPAADSKTAFVDVRDIAAVAICCLLEDHHLGKVYELTSDEALDHHQVAHKIALRCHRPVQYVPLSDEAFIDYKLSKGWSSDLAKHTVMLYRIVRQTSKEAKVSRDVERVLHRLPISFDEFVETHWRDDNYVTTKL
ncbi:MAG: NmrA family NAD(P)-binding protein [Bacteroidota bacterium]